MGGLRWALYNLGHTFRIMSCFVASQKEKKKEIERRRWNIILLTPPILRNLLFRSIGPARDSQWALLPIFFLTTTSFLLCHSLKRTKEIARIWRERQIKSEQIVCDFTSRARQNFMIINPVSRWVWNKILLHLRQFEFRIICKWSNIVEKWRIHWDEMQMVEVAGGSGYKAIHFMKMVDNFESFWVSKWFVKIY